MIHFATAETESLEKSTLGETSLSAMMKPYLTASNPNYFTDRERSCGNVKLDYIIHTWQSPVKEVSEDGYDNSHSFGLRPQRSGGGVVIKVRFLNDSGIRTRAKFISRPYIRLQCK